MAQVTTEYCQGGKLPNLLQQLTKVLAIYSLQKRYLQTLFSCQFQSLKKFTTEVP